MTPVPPGVPATLSSTAVLPPDPLRPARPTVLGEAFAGVLGAAQADAPWAYERLFRGFGPAVLGFVRVQGAEDPDGLANEVFLRAFTNLRGFTGDESAFRAWLFTIAHHAIVDERRRRARRPARADTDVPDRPVEGADTAALEHLSRDDVRALLDDLTPDQRTVLLLRLFGGQTVEQVAHTVGKRVGAVKALQRRGLAALRRRLEAEGSSTKPSGGGRTPPGRP